MLIHATSRWPAVINVYLWPYALRYAAEIHNNTILLQNESGKTPSEIFSGALIQPNLKYFHSFGCPAFVLDHRIKAAQKIDKWSVRSKIGVFLRMSPRHTRSVGLILNVQTGHVSPQFHWKADSTFATVTGKFGNV
jgi:hypothetical protein